MMWLCIEEVNEDNRRGTKLEQKKIESANTKEYRKWKMKKYQQQQQERVNNTSLVVSVYALWSVKVFVNI